jgi:hypothetical protein
LSWPWAKKGAGERRSVKTAKNASSVGFLMIVSLLSLPQECGT